MNTHLTSLSPTCALALLCPALLGFQQVPPSRAFEAATVKALVTGRDRPVPGFACRGLEGTLPAGVTREIPQGRCTGGSNLRFLTAYAYSVDPRNVSSRLDWVTAVGMGFQIEAKAENTDSVTNAELREMLRTLLSEQFKLQVHRETRDVQGYNLVIAKGGLKIHAAAADVRDESFGKVDPGIGIMTLSGRSSFVELLQMISGVVRAPVIDKTALTGRYDYRFTRPLNMTATSTASSFFTTIQEDLGLRLEPVSHVPQEVLIIDSAAKPSGGGSQEAREPKRSDVAEGFRSLRHLNVETLAGRLSLQRDIDRHAL